METAGEGSTKRRLSVACQRTVWPSLDELVAMRQSGNRKLNDANGRSLR